MEGNKDEALKCLSIAQRHRDSGNITSARKFITKSLNLYPTPEAQKLLSQLEIMTEGPKVPESGPSTPRPEAGYSTSAEAHPSASGTRHRANANGNAAASSFGFSEKKREYTAENEAVVKRVRTCRPTDFYGILGLEKECSEADVKKAYRKLALQLHPDKNGAPGADEAFKMVSKAFQILSDAQKRAAFDAHGSDPDSRFGGRDTTAMARNFEGFDGDFNPEDIFNAFFGGGLGQMGPGVYRFGNGGGGFTFQMGGAGFGPNFVNFGGGRQRRQGGEQEQGARSMLLQLLPILLMVAFTVLSALPNLFSGPTTPDPHFSFQRSNYYTDARSTGQHSVSYFVNPGEFTKHPLSEAGAPASMLSSFEKNVEHSYAQQLGTHCQREMNRREQRAELHMGVFGIGADWEKVRRIRQEEIASCTELKRLGYSIG